ncbi:MAG: dihydropyrimidinase [Bacteroidia bacterium]|nr:dihydropyrimidinase [Bacteroidia bacterium]
MDSILIRNGRIVTAEADFFADIYIVGEHIAAIGKDLPYSATQTIDANGLYVIPGGIDPHVHLEMPFMGTFSSDDYYTGTRAALFGGTTTVIDFVLQTQGRPLHEAYHAWQNRAKNNVVGDYSFHIAVTDFNPETANEIPDLIQKEGITSFKTFMAYKGALMIDDRQMTGLMQLIKPHNALVTVHATNGDMIDYLVAKFRSEGKLSPLYHYLSQPEITEAEASGRFADMTYYTDTQGYIVHMTCEGALNRVRKATFRNQKIFAETCIQYLMLDASLYDKGFESAKWVMSPPLREKKDQEALWAGIKQGLVQVVATDHCPFTWDKKLLGEKDFSKIPNGHPAIEHRIELLFSEGVAKKRITLQEFVALSATNAAKIFELYPRKGTLAIGSDADIVLFNPNTKHIISAKTHHMNVDYSAYEGVEVTGKCETVILRGQVVVQNNEFLAHRGYGKYLKRR